MYAYIINMDSATERWQYVSNAFQRTGIPFERFPAVNGRALQLPIAEFDEQAYMRRHGKRPNLAHIGCYLSHIFGLRSFLNSSHEYALMCEDDIQPIPELRVLLERAIEHRAHWDILRLSGFHDSHPQPFVALTPTHSLAISLTRLCGTGAYMVHRKAAEVLAEKLLPMTVPIDHALDREWIYGLRSVSISPLPIDQVEHGFASQLRPEAPEKLPAWRRYWTVFPYRAVNEIQRLLSRRRQFVQSRRATLQSR